LDILGKLEKVNIRHIPREANARANKLAQQVLGYDVRHGRFEVKQRPTPCDMLTIQYGHSESANSNRATAKDWKQELIEYISDPSCTQDRRVRQQALKYTMIDGVLFRQMIEGLLLRCLNDEEAKVAMGEVHEGL
jgi:hypothetical protein